MSNSTKYATEKVVDLHSECYRAMPGPYAWVYYPTNTIANDRSSSQLASPVEQRLMPLLARINRV